MTATWGRYPKKLLPKPLPYQPGRVYHANVNEDCWMSEDVRALGRELRKHERIWRRRKTYIDFQIYQELEMKYSGLIKERRSYSTVTKFWSVAVTLGLSIVLSTAWWANLMCPHYRNKSFRIIMLCGGIQTIYSTETALLAILGDLLAATDAGLGSVLLLLDLSAEFDTVDYCFGSSGVMTRRWI